MWLVKAGYYWEDFDCTLFTHCFDSLGDGWSILIMSVCMLSDWLSSVVSAWHIHAEYLSLKPGWVTLFESKLPSTTVSVKKLPVTLKEQISTCNGRVCTSVHYKWNTMEWLTRTMCNIYSVFVILILAINYIRNIGT